MKTSLVLLLMTLPVMAAEQRVELSVPGMNCISCPLTVKTALLKVPGVKSAEVNYENKRTIVTFDDHKTAIAQLIRATADAGYPSHIVDKTQ